MSKSDDAQQDSSVTRPFIKRLINWIRKPIEQQIESFTIRYYNYENIIFSKKYSLDFEGNIPNTELVADSEFSLKNATAYQPYSNRSFKTLIREAISTGMEFDNLIDIGCGKGKQCIYAAKYFNFDKVIGIDFSKPLIDIANRNLIKTNYNNVNFINADAVEWKIPDGNSIVFLYNPFNEIIFEQFLLSNLDYFRNHPSIIAYANDLHRNILVELGFEMLYRDQHSKNSLYRFKQAPLPL